MDPERQTGADSEVAPHAVFGHELASAGSGIALRIESLATRGGRRISMHYVLNAADAVILGDELSRAGRAVLSGSNR